MKASKAQGPGRVRGNGSLRGAIATLAACVPLAAGCTTPRTEVVAVIASDFDWGPGAALQTVGITVRSDGPGGTLRDDRVVALGREGGLSALPASFGLVPLSNDASRTVWLEVRGCGGPNCGAGDARVTQRVILGFVPRQTLRLDLFLARNCLDIRCDPDQTCDPAQRRCVSAHVDPTTLPQYAPDAAALDATSDVALDSPVDSPADTIPEADAASSPPASALAAGNDVTCAGYPAGSFYCWGINANYELGLGDDLADRAVPTLVPGLTGVTSASGGSASACAVAQGTVSCWGLLPGGGTAQPFYLQSTPMPVPGVPAVSEVHVGVDSACALDATGAVWCWGMNGSGQLGDTGPSRNTGAMVAGISGARSLCVADEYACVAQADGTVACWGSNSQGALGTLPIDSPPHPIPQPVPGVTNAIAVSCGDYGGCALRSDGTVWCWGSNGNAVLDPAMPSATYAMAAPVDGVSGVAQLSVGEESACGLRSDGTVLCWGLNGDGNHGTGSESLATLPTVVPGLDHVSRVSVGSRHACAARLDGSIWCWGDNTQGELGDGVFGEYTRAPVAIPHGVGAVAVSFDITRGYVSASDGNVYAVGSTTSDPLTTVSNPPPVVLVPGAGAPSAIAAGIGHACAAYPPSGGVKCWGASMSHVLGDAVTQSDSPVTTMAPASTTAVTSTFSTVYALDSSGAVWSWGTDAQGELGNDAATDADRFTPVQVALTGPATSVVGGESHACATLPSPEPPVECWGTDDMGQAGTGTPSGIEPVPVAATGLPTAAGTRPVELALGYQHTCARTEDGRVYCWGANDKGQLGTGMADVSPHPTPALLPSPTGVVRIVAGSQYTCALDATGTVWCWGANDAGQIGPGPNVVTTPRPFVEFQGAADLFARVGETCARFTPGGVMCVGYSLSGQLGPGVHRDEPSPVRVVGLPTP